MLPNRIEVLARAIRAHKGVHNLVIQYNGHGWMAQVYYFIPPDYEDYNEFRGSTILDALSEAAADMNIEIEEPTDAND